MVLNLASFKRRMHLRGFKLSPKCLAKPLPEPHGITPSAVEVPTKTFATSLMEPSPPTAVTTSYFPIASAAISSALPAYCV